MELVLDLQCREKDNEPYFRHIAKKWTREFHDKRYEVSIHTNMYTEAASVLCRLAEVLTEEYGPEVANAIGKPIPMDDDDYVSTTLASLITLETEDRYMNGKGKFVFEGLEKAVGESNETQKREERC